MPSWLMREWNVPCARLHAADCLEWAGWALLLALALWWFLRVLHNGKE